MKLGFKLKGNHVFECRWSTFTGSEVYLLNGEVIHTQRSFKATGKREFNLNLDGEPHQLVIELIFRPSIQTLYRSNGYAAPVYLDGEPYIEDLLAREYRIRSKTEKVLSGVIGFVAGAGLLLFVDQFIFDGRLLDLPQQPLSLRLELINAAIGTSDCFETLDEYDRSLVIPLDQAAQLRIREMRRRDGWEVDHDETVLSVIAATHWGSPPVCQQAIRGLMRQYLLNGADVNQRFGFRQMTLLESAIIGGDKPLVCFLLRQGASLDEQVIAHRNDGADSKITGMNLVELAGFMDQQASYGDTNMTDIIHRYQHTGDCVLLNTPAD